MKECVHKVVEMPFGEVSCELNKTDCNVCGVQFREYPLSIREGYKISIWYTVQGKTVSIRSHQENPDYEIGFRLMDKKLHKFREFKQPWAIWPSPKVRSKMYGFAGAILNKKRKEVFQEVKASAQVQLNLAL